MVHLCERQLQAGSELRETHISRVYLREGEAWKLKKPVALGFLDWTTLPARKAACEAEVSLNRRLAPDVYLGVVPLYAGGAGEATDYAVHMRRLRDEDSAQALLARGQLTAAHVRALAERLAQFHASCACDEHTARFGRREVIADNVTENFRQTAAHIAEYVGPEIEAEIERFQLGFLAQHAELFSRRLTQGRVRDGHGDLRLEHVFFEGDRPPSVIDCIEFNERFRYADVCADVAFLAMDLCWHGRADLGELFLSAYARASGDHDLYALVDFYGSYRAYVRGKVSSFLGSDQAQPDSVRARAHAEGRKYFLLAQSYARRSVEPQLVLVVCGVIGTGKSTWAQHAAERLCAPVLDADRTRKQLAHVSPTASLGGAAFSGAYGAQATERVYDELLRRAAVILRSGRSVVLDASFRSAAHRQRARRLAGEHGASFALVETRAPEPITRERLRRRDRHASVSDGRESLYDAFVARWEPITEVPAAEHLVLDTAGAAAQTQASLDAFLLRWR